MACRSNIGRSRAKRCSRARCRPCMKPRPRRCWRRSFTPTTARLYDASVARAVRRRAKGKAASGLSRRRSRGRTASATDWRRSPPFDETPEIVLIQDAARPFADAALDRSARSRRREAHGAAVPGVPLPIRSRRSTPPARSSRRPIGRGCAPCRRRRPFASNSF